MSQLLLLFVFLIVFTGGITFFAEYEQYKHKHSKRMKTA